MDLCREFNFNKPSFILDKDSMLALMSAFTLNFKEFISEFILSPSVYLTKYLSLKNKNIFSKNGFKLNIDSILEKTVIPIISENQQFLEKTHLDFDFNLPRVSTI